MPAGLYGKSVADVICKRTDKWNAERAKKNKEQYTYVGWMPEDMPKITLSGSDQVYIKGHHQAGLGFISDINAEEEEQKVGKKKLTVQAIRLEPKDLAARFCHCFAGEVGFTGKVKFFNCSSGVNGGASFAKKAAVMLRAHFPKATYIGYEDKLSMGYGDYNPDSEDEQLRKLLRQEEPSLERRKMGTTTGERAKSLHIKL